MLEAPVGKLLYRPDLGRTLVAAMAEEVVAVAEPSGWTSST